MDKLRNNKLFRRSLIALSGFVLLLICLGTLAFLAQPHDCTPPECPGSNNDKLLFLTFYLVPLEAAILMALPLFSFLSPQLASSISRRKKRALIGVWLLALAAFTITAILFPLVGGFIFILAIGSFACLAILKMIISLVVYLAPLEAVLILVFFPLLSFLLARFVKVSPLKKQVLVSVWLLVLISFTLSLVFHPNGIVDSFYSYLFASKLYPKP